MIIKMIAAFVLIGCAAPTIAGEMQRLKSVGDAVKLAEAIPVNAENDGTKNVAQRMKAAGITITGGRQYSYASKAELDEPTDRVGDVHLHIDATEPSDAFKHQTCDMWGDAAFLKRGGKYYPESRAANWLMTGKCSTNFLKPHQ
jgi:hypothetical protein